ncbi:hypothetical protein BJ944DRAFT_261815 [Cunninghamella echinulata]|nr:hypothetical protein BJ944DRAFT_261815 [Cunninghamella echinulata]
MTAHTTQSSPSTEASQPSSLPTPPVLKAETFTWILRPPPFPPPPTSTSTSNLHIEQCIINNDSEILYEMEDFVFNSTSAPSPSYRITGDTTIPSFDDDSFYDTNNNNNNYNNNNNNDSRINVMQATTIITSPTSSVTDFNTNFNDFVIYDPLSTSPPSNIDLFPPL